VPSLLSKDLSWTGTVDLGGLAVGRRHWEGGTPRITNPLIAWRQRWGRPWTMTVGDGDDLHRVLNS
jgi:hypothetical protein